jgi:serine/threonine protein kinase/Tol biopolymer transport system component
LGDGVEEMTLAIGTRIGPYEIQSAIGAGGMGEVYRARDTKLARDVAVKVLPAALSSDPDRLTRFAREAQVLASLNHPNIAAIYHVEEAEGSSALVMELVDGETLADRIARGPIPIDEALPIARQIAEALEAAHEQSIIHRDLKPANIKMRPDGTVKVLDFGLAKLAETASGHSATGGLSLSPTITSPALMTGVGLLLGTAAYMSPEQAAGKAVDKRSDLWAFGVVMLEMLTGRQAFSGETVSHVIASVLKDEPAWTTLPPGTPAPIRRLLRRCLEKDRKRRLPDAADIRLEIDDALTTPVVDLPVTPIVPRSRERLLWLSIVALVTLLAGAATTAWLRDRASSVPPPVTRLDLVTPPTDDPFSFALSPDGRQVAFVANVSGGAPQLWLRPLDQVTAQPLAGTEGATYPFWAPDGRAVGFFADGKLKRLDLAGGAPQVLADAPQGRGGTWNSDGVIVFTPTAGPTAVLMRVMASGGTPVPLTRLAAGQGNSHRWPQFLPDGRHVLFFVGLGQPETHGVYVVSLDGGEPTRVLTGETAAVYAAPGYLLRVSQGVLVAQRFDAARATVSGEPIPVAQAVGTDDGTWRSAFSVSAAGVLAYRPGTGARRQLVWVDHMGKVLGSIGQPDENTLANPALAPDGQRAAVTRSVQGNYDVWLIDLGRGVPSRFTFDAAQDQMPAWSSDGRQVVFTSSRKGVWDLFEKASNGADDQPLLVSAQDKAPLDWSPDGRVLLYATQDPKTASDLWALPLTGERKPFPVVQTSFDDIEGQFSPDGRWLAYASNESGRYEIHIRSFPEPSGKWQVSAAGGLQPRWGRDGRELFFVAPDTRLMAVPIRVASDRREVDVGAPVALFPTRLASGSGVIAAGFNARAQYMVAPDGRFLMNVSVAEAGPASPITIIQNWTAALRK